MINKIIEQTGVKIDIEEDGKVFVATADTKAGMKAISIIEGIAKDAVPGEIYTGYGEGWVREDRYGRCGRFLSHTGSQIDRHCGGLRNVIIPALFVAGIGNNTDGSRTATHLRVGDNVLPAEGVYKLVIRHISD